MTISVIPPDAADIERGLGAVPLEEIEAELDATEDEWSALKPMHGPANRWEHFRKNILAVRRLAIRDEMINRGAKCTESFLDDLAHADKTYRDFLDKGLLEAVRYEVLESERGKHERRAMRGQSLMRSTR